MILLRGHMVGGERQAIAILGLGLIGQAILAATRRYRAFDEVSLPISWTDTALRRGQLAAALTAIGSRDQPQARIDIVWSAGRAGFGATQDELAAEEEPFLDILALADRLVGIAPKTRHGFHFMSSAGGLFEGCRLVDATTEPSPRRHYGIAKVRQEALVQAMRPEIASFIYRPSSTYGLSDGTARLSLINVLIANALRKRVSHLFGDQTTLRDYIQAGDIGSFVAGRLVGHAPNPGTFLLASGQATALQAIVHLVEAALGTRLLLRIDPRPSNAEHMSFRPAALAPGFVATDLAAGIRQIAQRHLYC